MSFAASSAARTETLAAAIAAATNQVFRSIIVLPIRIDVVPDADRPSWMSKLDPGALKLMSSIAAISGLGAAPDPAAAHGGAAADRLASWTRRERMFCR